MELLFYSNLFLPEFTSYFNYFSLVQLTFYSFKRLQFTFKELSLNFFNFLIFKINIYIKLPANG